MKSPLIFLTSLLSSITFAQDALDLNPQIDALEPQQLSSVLVMHKGELLFESYYNGTSRDDLHDIRSASKTLTGLMFGKAIEDGYFNSVNDKVLPVFIEYKTLQYPSERKSAMTFFDLLTMTNPLECDDWNPFSRGHEERMYLVRDWVAFFLNLPERANPPWEPKLGDNPYGRDFSYCTAGISIAAAAIERQSGLRFSDYTERTLFQPLGIGATIWPYNHEGITQGGGGLKIRPLDLLKVGQLILNEGQWQGEQLVPADWIEKSLTSYSIALAEQNATYGITWWQFSYPYNDERVNAWAATGNGGNYLYVVPELELTAVITATAYNTRYMHQQTQKIFSQVILPAISR